MPQQRDEGTAHTFGQWLQQQRKQLDLTQVEFAQQVGCSRDTLRKMEADIHRPSKQMFARLADCLDVPEAERGDLQRLARGGAAADSPQRGSKAPSLPPSPVLLQGVNPTPLTAVLGREHELEFLRARLIDQGLRLLTLTGPGGVGKTRLALQLLDDLRPDFPQRTFFIPLAPLHDASLVLASMTQQLGLKEINDQSGIEHLAAYLGAAPTLLLLDNFEHLLPATPLVTRLLELAPQLKILVTSRTPLHLYGEYELRVSPLAVPDLRQSTSLVELAQSPAVALFVERASALRSDFRLTRENAASVVEICQRLDGLPLALELAAARSKLLDPTMLLGYLTSRLAVLTGGPSNVLPHHQSLRKTIDWSYELLSPRARTLFAQLSVFAGGCTLEAIAAVCTGPDLDSVTLLDHLTRLVDDSMIKRAASSTGELRLEMLETLREYAQERLTEQGELDLVCQRHANYYLALAERAAPLLKGESQEIGLTLLEEDYHNIRAVLIWTTAHQPEQALRLSAAMGRFWYMRGYFSEGRQWLQTTLAHAETGSAVSRADALHSLGVLAYAQAAYAQAATVFEATLAIRRELGDIPGTISMLNNLALIARVGGQYDQAVRILEACEPLCREVGDPWALALCLNNLGSLALHQTDFEQAARYFNESLPLREALGDSWGLSLTLNYLGWLAYCQKNYDRAAEMLSRALIQAEKIAYGRMKADIFEIQGRVCLAQGNLERARALLLESTRIRREEDEKHSLQQSLDAIAMLLLAEGHADQAASMLGAAAALRKAHGISSTPLECLLVEATMTAAQAQLGQEAYTTAWEAGATTSLDELLALLFAPADSPS